MRVLVLGTGAVGGYFGGRLVEKSEAVTFLVRENRKKQLDQTGLVIKSVHGDFQSQINTIVSGEAVKPYDLIILSVKSYHLEHALSSVAPYVGENTVILPLLNGLSHVQKLQEHFGNEKVIGGLCFVEATLNEHGAIIQASPRHDIIFGELDGTLSPRIEKISQLFTGANFIANASTTIHRDMWNKYIFISALSGMTCIMESAVGPIIERVEGKEVYQLLLNEIYSIAKATGVELDNQIVQKTMDITIALNYEMKASMYKDMEKGLQIESEHLQGNLIKLADQYGIETPILKTIYTKLKIYEQKRISGIETT
jgi:2-dehydropantoate 2-reductase